MGAKGDASSKGGDAVIERERCSIKELRDGHGVLVRVPAEKGLAIVDIGVVVLILYVEGVGLSHHGVGHEEIFVGCGSRGEIVKSTFATEAAIA